MEEYSIEYTQGLLRGKCNRINSGSHMVSRDQHGAGGFGHEKFKQVQNHNIYKTEDEGVLVVQLTLTDLR